MPNPGINESNCLIYTHLLPQITAARYEREVAKTVKQLSHIWGFRFYMNLIILHTFIHMICAFLSIEIETDRDKMKRM